MTPRIAARIREVLDATPGVLELKMFGGLAFLVSGNIAAVASSRGGMMIRAGPGDDQTPRRNHPSRVRPDAGSRVAWLDLPGCCGHTMRRRTNRLDRPRCWLLEHPLTQAMTTFPDRLTRAGYPRATGSTSDDVCRGSGHYPMYLRTFYYLAVTRGEIPCIRIGRRILIPTRAVQRVQVLSRRNPK